MPELIHFRRISSRENDYVSVNPEFVCSVNFDEDVGVCINTTGKTFIVEGSYNDTLKALGRLSGNHLLDDLKAVINRHSRENASNTPDFILAQFLLVCLNAYEGATIRRDSWYNIKPQPGGCSD